MSKSSTKTPLLLAGWVALAALLNCVGWLLSGLHQLNATGYGGVLVAAGLWLVWWWRAGNGRDFQGLSFHKQKRRFRRFLPLAFLLLSGMAILGGVLHPPTNYDALAYRMPRILHWLAAERWIWVHTIFNRLNTRAVAFEWMAAPLMVFTKTDRLTYLINVISFLLLPGLMFSIMVRLGARRRVAWRWMWVLPTGLSYLLQSASLGNDMFGAMFGLAALDLVLRARDSKRFPDIWLSMLAAALVSGGKLSNQPLLLPWLIAFLPSVWLLKKRLVTSAAMVVAAIVCSFFPMALANAHYCGDWTGFAAEATPFNKPTYALHLAFNTVLLTVENLVPPVFPFKERWNATMRKVIPPALTKRLEENFEPGQAHISLDEMQVEETAGLGCGLTSLLLATVFATVLRAKRAGLQLARGRPIAWAILLPSLFALGVFMAKSGFATEARLVTPYYGIVLGAFLALLCGEAQARVMESKWWNAWALVGFVMAAVLLVISPPRPLWPAQTVLGRVQGHSAGLTRARRVYAVYANRADAFAPAIAALPPGLKVLGFVTFDLPETSLWRPFGARRIVHVIPTDTREDLRRSGIEYVLVSEDEYRQYFPLPFAQWLAQMNAEVVRDIPLDLRAGKEASQLHLVRLKE